MRRPPRLSDYRPDLAGLDDVFFKALAKEPADRFDRCRQFAAAFSEQIAGCGRAGDRRSIADPASARQSAPAEVDAEGRYCRGDRSGTAALAVTWAISFFSWDDQPQVNTASPPRVNKTSTSGSALAAPPLNGSYRLDYDRAKQTSNGVIRTNGGDTTWWAFSSACTAPGARRPAPSSTTPVTRPRRPPAPATPASCITSTGIGKRAAADAGPVPARPAAAPIVTQSETVVWSLTPEPDGTLRGVQTQAVQTNECGSQGATLRIPVVGIPDR